MSISFGIRCCSTRLFCLKQRQRGINQNRNPDFYNTKGHCGRPMTNLSKWSGVCSMKTSGATRDRRSQNLLIGEGQVCHRRLLRLMFHLFLSREDWFSLYLIVDLADKQRQVWIKWSQLLRFGQRQWIHPSFNSGSFVSLRNWAMTTFETPQEEIRKDTRLQREKCRIC